MRDPRALRGDGARRDRRRHGADRQLGSAQSGRDGAAHARPAPRDRALDRAGGGAGPVRRAVLRGGGVRRPGADARRLRGRVRVVGHARGPARRPRRGHAEALLADVLHADAPRHVRDRSPTCSRCASRPASPPTTTSSACRDRRSGRTDACCAIVRVLAPNPSVYTLEGTNTWIVGAEPSIVIDPGPDDRRPSRRGRARGRPRRRRPRDPRPRGPRAGSAGVRRTVGAPLYAFRLPGAEHVRDGQRFFAPTAPRSIAEYTPGHSSDHVAFFVPSERALFTGDAVVGRGTSFIDPPDGDLVQYLRSLHRMQELDPRTIYPGHGPIVIDARAKLEEYVTHREERERQVRGAARHERPFDPRPGRDDLRRAIRPMCTPWPSAPSSRTC